jgi:hypothetical protein
LFKTHGVKRLFWDLTKPNKCFKRLFKTIV